MKKTNFIKKIIINIVHYIHIFTFLSFISISILFLFPHLGNYGVPIKDVDNEDSTECIKAICLPVM